MVSAAGSLTGVRPPPGRPWVIAHRGASAAYPENTSAAFRAAHRLGADAVEFDVRRTADGAPVIHHDAVVAGVGPIVSVTAAQLRRRAPLIPTLEEALDACADMWVDVEVKNSPRDPDWDPEHALVTPVVECLQAAGLLESALVSSFHAEVLARTRRLAPTLALGWLVEEWMPPEAALAETAAAGYQAFLPPAADLAGDAAPGLIAAAHRSGLQLICWTVDDPAEGRRLAAAGIDGVVTNRPDLLGNPLGAAS
jgi:glycerophosphoryl diester phosphodiesterase